jgi:O-methyltransferase involved in polyketide biosynthesis
MEGYDFRRVSFTALVPAFARGAYTGIPFAKEMLDLLGARGATLPEGPWSQDSARQYASLFEARFRAVSHLVEERRATQVLELAAGLSPRGIDFAGRGFVYVEADLPESSAMKQEIVTSILGAIPQRLHLYAASAIDGRQLLACCSPFDAAQPVAVTTEGLLRYLTFEEKARVAANVLEILERYGGWWITPDVHLKSWVERQTAALRDKERETLGRSLDANYFNDMDHAREFFEECGFAVDSRPLLECLPGPLASSRTEEVTAFLNGCRMFILTAKR